MKHCIVLNRLKQHHIVKKIKPIVLTDINLHLSEGINQSGSWSVENSLNIFSCVDTAKVPCRYCEAGFRVIFLARKVHDLFGLCDCTLVNCGQNLSVRKLLNYSMHIRTCD